MNPRQEQNHLEHPDATPLVSVVTPVYNTEKYLSECIESVLRQTYTNFEYIIVNNCSTDRSLEIAQQYAARDRRIRVVNSDTFRPVIANWNFTMRQISQQSRYCKMVHADDWLFPECLAQMVAIAEHYPGVGIVGAYRLEEAKVTLDGVPYATPVIAGKDMCRQCLLGGPFVFGSPTSVMLRADLVRSRAAVYDEQNLHADLETCFDLLQESDFGFVHQVLTFTRRHNEAITSFSRRMSTYYPGNLAILLHFGPLYLTSEQYKGALRRHMAAYYGLLGKALLQRRDKEFWNYHSTELRKLNMPLDRARLRRTAAALVLERAVDPNWWMQKARNIFAGRQQTASLSPQERTIPR